MQVLNLLVFGTNGLILSKKYPDAVGKDVILLSFKLTEEMRPEARGLVFYVRPQDGVMVYDEFSISLGFLIDNFVSNIVRNLKNNQIVSVAF